MLIALVIILLLIGAAVVGSIYSNFTVFYSNFAESENYHKAYYSSISALERSELVVKQRQPGYIGNGGWKINEEGSIGSYEGGGSDKIISNFSYLSNDASNKNTSTIFRNINSRTSRIPSEGDGDIDSMLASEDSKDYNMMDYKDSQVFLLYYDKSTDNPYEKVSCKDGSASCEQSKPEEIKGLIRLPGKLKEFFGPLNTNEALNEKIAGGPKDDAIVDRQIRGKFKPENQNQTYPFTIYSTQSYSPRSIIENLDSAIRETDINGTETSPRFEFNFGKNSKWSPSIARGNDANFTIISPKETDIKTDANNEYFKQILKNGNYSEKQLRFSLLNLLKSEKNMVYPFLEYYVDFGTEISDKYFTINAEGNYGDYQIDRIIRKPTNKESILGSFTTIF